MGSLYCDVFITLGELISKGVEISGTEILPFIVNICSVYKQFLVDCMHVPEQFIAIYLFNNLVEFGEKPAQSIYSSWVPYVVQVINTEHPGLRKAAITGISLLAEFTQDLFPQILANVINRLNAVIVAKSSRLKQCVAATQTAIATVGKIIELYPSHIDLPQVLPIWFNYLPVTDSTEAVTIYQQLCSIFLRYTDILLGENFSNLPRILQLFSSVMGTNLVSNDTCQTMISIIKQMQADFPGELMQQAWVMLSPAQQENLRKALA